MTKTPSPWPFVISLALVAIPGTALILLVPQLFQSGSNPAPWVLGALGGLVFAGAHGTRHFRPEHPTSDTN